MATEQESEALYRELGGLLAATPGDLFGPAPISADTHRWLGQGHAVLDQILDQRNAAHLMEKISYRSACDGLHGLLRETNAHTLLAILHRALAVVERKAPTGVRGAFIAGGSAFDIFQKLGQVLGEAKEAVLIADPYMGAKALTDFAPLIDERVRVDLLADSAFVKSAALLPATARWNQQYADSRPLEVRVTPSRLMHDRLIIIDDKKVWTLTQSLEHFANRAHGSVIRIEGEMVEQKIHAYRGLWNSATPLVAER